MISPQDESTSKIICANLLGMARRLEGEGKRFQALGVYSKVMDSFPGTPEAEEARQRHSLLSETSKDPRASYPA